jgi:RNase P subunit RPR2
MRNLFTAVALLLTTCLVCTAPLTPPVPVRLRLRVAHDHLYAS